MTSTLINKIATASLKVGALTTDKRNEQQRYDYISADKVLERAGDALAKTGVVVVPSITSENTEAVKTDKGGTRYDSTVHFGFIISDGESQLEMPWCGRGSDYSSPDKALYKAITSGHKYFLMKLLNIGVGNEDGEHEEMPQIAQDAAPQTQQRPRPQPSPAQDVEFRRTPDTTEDDPQPNSANPTAEELAIINQWGNRTEAEMWAVMVGACENEHHARNSMAKSIARCGGKVTKENYLCVYVDFYRRQQEKLARQKEAA